MESAGFFFASGATKPIPWGLHQDSDCLIHLLDCSYMYQYFGGVTHILVPDNTKTAVIHNNDWYNQELNTIYHEMAEH